MQLAVKDINGKELKSIELPESIYGVPLNDHLLHQVVKAYRANRRQGTHATKTRSTVSGGGKKPFKQKGTGNARQGSSRAPHYPGGAVVHGPQPRDYSQKINQKARLQALRVAISDKVRHGKLTIVDQFAVETYSTKHMLKALSSLDASHALVADLRHDDLLYKSTRNLKSAAAKQVLEINAEDVLRYQNFVISEQGLSALTKRLGGGE